MALNEMQIPALIIYANLEQSIQQDLLVNDPELCTRSASSVRSGLFRFGLLVRRSVHSSLETVSEYYQYATWGRFKYSICTYMRISAVVVAACLAAATNGRSNWSNNVHYCAGSTHCKYAEPRTEDEVRAIV